MTRILTIEVVCCNDMATGRHIPGISGIRNMFQHERSKGAHCKVVVSVPQLSVGARLKRAITAQPISGHFGLLDHFELSDQP
jgi:hypothetical protein